MTIKLEDAVAVVQKEVREWRAKYESVAKAEEQDPIMIEGETTAGYFCQLMVDPRDVAKIFVDYAYFFNIVIVVIIPIFSDTVFNL